MRFRARAQHGQRLRMQVGRGDDRVGLAARGAMRHRHRLGHRGAFVEQRGIRHRQARQVTDHGLEIHQRFEPPLRDLGLVGRIGRVPARVLQHVAQDDRRRQRAVVAEPDQRLDVGAVAPCQFAQLSDDLCLCHRWRQRREVRTADRARHGARGEVREALRTDHLQHGRDLVRRRADVAAGEFVVFLEFEEGRGAVHERVSTKAA